MKNSKNLIKAIQSKNIKQSSRQKFVIKNIFFWTLFIFSIAIGAISFSIIIFAFTQSEFDLLTHVTHSKVEFFLRLLPIFWIILCILFLLFSIFGMRHVKYGYRYSSILVFSSNIVLSIVLGTIFFFTGGAEIIEHVFDKNVPFYESIEEKRFSRWSMPENGFLSGTIIEKGESLMIEDWNGKRWNIDISNARVRNKVSLENNEIIKIIGKISTNTEFSAEEIRPWEGQEKRQNH